MKMPFIVQAKMATGDWAGCGDNARTAGWRPPIGPERQDLRP